MKSTTRAGEVQLFEAIRKAIKQDAEEAAEYRDRDGLSHDWALKELRLDPKQLSTMLETLDAKQSVRTNVPVTLIHHWTNGDRSGTEEINYLHFVDVRRKEAATGVRYCVDATFGCYWELIPDGSPGALTEADYNPMLSSGQQFQRGEKR